MTTILTIVAVSLAGSFICSLFEAVLYSIPPTRVEEQRRKGLPGAAMLAKLRAKIDEPIAAILTVNTITHTIGASWAGALVGEIYGVRWVTWFAIAFTIAILFITEIIPKTLGVVHANTLARLTAWPIQLLIWAVYPLAWLSVQLTRGLIGKKKITGPSEDEILVMADQALHAGKLLAEERVLITNALALNNVTARDLMTPRTVVETVDAEKTVAEALAEPTKVRHSRLPVVERGELDQTLGIVHRRDLFDRLASGEGGVKVRDLVRRAIYVPQTVAANELLQHLLKKRQHLALVVSEHGDVRGVVTLEDVLEYLLGQEIVDEYDQHVNPQDEARKMARKKFDARGEK